MILDDLIQNIILLYEKTKFTILYSLCLQFILKSRSSKCSSLEIYNPEALP